ncbi:hypothetical protein ABES58_04380 [Paenibacillus lautus]|uniref:hypothetical protein n=1 Tax=Paenibacillus lautus TaxID=1401 RepID=UPI003D2E21B9
MNNQVKPKHNFKFGDLIENHYASEDNPRRIGIFVKKDSNGHFEMTDGKGKFWLSANDNDKLVKVGSIISDTPPVPTYKPGDGVRHEIYGNGIVMSEIRTTLEVEVDFDLTNTFIVPVKDLEVVE